MRQFTGAHPAFGQTQEGPQQLPCLFPLEDPSPPVSPLPHPFTDLLVSLFFFFETMAIESVVMLLRVFIPHICTVSVPGPPPLRFIPTAL